MSQLREKLADLCHYQWSGWMKYLFSKSTTNPDGSVTIPKALVDRWQRQHNADYQHLTEPEQNSDRTEANKFLLLIANHSLTKIPGEVKTIPPMLDQDGQVIHPNLDNEGYPKQ